MSGAPHRSGYDGKVKKTDCSRKLKRVWMGTSDRRVPEGQDDPGLSGVRQKDRRTLSWVESGQVDTAKWEVIMVLRRTPRFQEGTESSDFRKRCADEGNNGWLGRRRVRVAKAKGAEQVRMALEWLTESCEQVTGALNRSGGSSYRRSLTKIAEHSGWCLTPPRMVLTPSFRQ